jgi:Fur family ferric uptake transcriptional regulator
MATRAQDVMAALRARGYRMTVQRRAIVAEIMATSGHIAPQQVAQHVKQRLPGINDSTVYRTIDLLEELGYISHAHLESGPRYHHAGRADHVHLVCSSCGRSEALSLDETEPLRRLLTQHNGFLPDFSHFAISGLCRDCQRQAEGRA